MVAKKTYWRQTGFLMQNAIIDGLHCDPSVNVDSPYRIEMKRRLWATICEVDLQNAFQFGLPTLLHNIDTDIGPPANLDDEDFDENTKELPLSKPPDEYTCASYQYHSWCSWSLRLEISQRLFSPKFSRSLDYDDVLRYTQQIRQAIDDLPSCHGEEQIQGRDDTDKPVAYAYLHFQLMECILALHRPYLKRGDNRFWLSESICYQTSRDILLLNRMLVRSGARRLALLRDDLLLASLKITKLTLLQPNGQFCLILLCDCIFPMILRRDLSI